MRLQTNGAPVATAWDTDTDFTSGVNFQSLLFPPLGVSTLSVSGSGSAAALTLPATLLPLTPDAANPVLRPAAATVLDNDAVDDPALAKVGSTYYMWYSGTAEDGGGPAIFLATSTNGTTWTRANGGSPVLQGTAGAFDEDGVYGADVIYDATNAAAPFRMWYSGRADVFGGIGYATSLDGVTWTKYASSGVPAAVVSHGPPGSADSFAAADPTVLQDGSVLKMWYTGDDSNKKRIAYATSSDGIIWAKGGKVIAPEDAGTNANIQFGAFAPTVWKTSSGYSMLLTGRKLVSGGNVFQTKLMSSTSSDGITWSSPSVALNTAGTSSKFDFSNLNSPEVLADPGSASPYKLYYSGNTIDANGNFHTRIGLATSNDGGSFSRFNGAQTGGSVFDIGTLGTAFDGRQASGLSVAAPVGANPKFAGFYWGTRGSDFTPRLGEATSADGTSWTKVAVSTPDGGALFPLGNAAAFDNGGERDPSALYDSGTYDLYFTGLDSSGVASIGFASASQDGSTKQPNNSTWSARSQVLAKGSSGAFDSAAVSHPSALKDGSTYVLYYGGSNGTVWKIGRATASAPGGAFTKDASPVLDVGSAGSFDEKGVKDPVIVKVGATDYRMLYTGVDADGIERVGYATSTNGTSWTKRGVALDPSLTAFAADEVGVEATGMLVDGSTLHVWTSGLDRTGRTRGDHATTAFPTAAGSIPTGWATYQLGNASTDIRDFRQLDRTSSGNVAVWMSFLQPYSSNSSEFWSDYFPVTASSPSEALNFLLTVHGVRWQARLSAPSSSPSLDKIQLTHAPVSFTPSGSALSVPITAAAGRIVTAWGSLVVNSSLFTPGGGGTGSATVRVLDATSGAQLASVPLNLAGDTTVDLSSISAASYQTLRVELDLASADGQATPRVNSFKVLYTTQPAPIALTLAASPLRIVFGKRVTLSGTLMQGATPLTGQTVVLSAKAAGTSTFNPLTSVTTDAAGAFRTTTAPSKNTTYKASFSGASSEPTVSVSVAYRVTLRVVRKGSRWLFSGRVAPSRRGGPLVVQVKTRSGWKTFAKLKLSRKSSFTLLRRLAHGKYRFRARTPADRAHLAGTSRIVAVKA